MNQRHITLEEIRQRKLRLRKQILQKKKTIKAKANTLFSPIPVRNKFELGYQWVSNSLAIFDGIKIGWKAVRYLIKR